MIVETYEDVFPNIEEKPTPIPWIDIPKINADISVDGWGGTSSYALFYLIDNNESTGIKTIEGFPFSPSRYTIQAWRTWNEDYASTSFTLYDWSVKWYITKKRTASEVESDQNTWSYNESVYVVNVNTDDDRQTYATHDSFTSSWIKINVWKLDVDVWLIITAYK